MTNNQNEEYYDIHEYVEKEMKRISDSSTLIDTDNSNEIKCLLENAFRAGHDSLVNFLSNYSWKEEGERK